MIEYIVARSSQTRLCPGLPLCSFTSYCKKLRHRLTSSSDNELVGICGMAVEGGAYGEGRTGT